ncbi:MAG: SCO family protein [Dehalococcoidia bacterium]|nr:SCO family protein [Dehalococcoidia bacterium]
MRCYTLAVAALLSLILASCQPGEASPTPPAQAAPQFSLVDQDGQEVTSADLRGKVVLVDFIYTSCPDACPALEAIMDNVRRNLGDAFPGKVNLVSVTFDPEYDTPAVLKRYASGAGWDISGWHFLTGSQEDVASVNAAFGSIYQMQGENVGQGSARAFVHNTLIVLIDQDGKVRRHYSGPDLSTSPKILDDVRALLR